MNTQNQNNRLLYVDLARGLAVFFMIAVHTITVFGNKDANESLLGQIIGFLGSAPAAPVFMTLMGFSFLYSKKRDFKLKLFRGLKIFLLGYILNLFRGVIPFIIAKHVSPDIINSTNLKELNAYELFFMIDILQFAGIALMLLAIIQKYNLNKYIVLATSILIALISPLLWGIKTNNPAFDFILNLLWGDYKIPFIENRNAFPLFPWLTFPLLGMFLGIIIKNSTKQQIIIKRTGIIGFVVMLIGIIIIATNFEYQLNDYYHSRQGAMIFMCGFVMLWLFICKLLIDYIPNNFVFNLTFNWSIGVTNIYFIQWILIVWSIALFGLQNSSAITVILLIALFTMVSQLASNLIFRIKGKKNY